MDKSKKIQLLDRMVDRYCISYLKTTKNGRCDGKCPFMRKCSIDYIKKHPREIENMFESIKQTFIEKNITRKDGQHENYA